MRLVIDQNSFLISGSELSDLERIGTTSWEEEIRRFLTQWLDNSSYIELYTSGSTGTPKKIQLPKETMIQSALSTNAFFELDEHSVSLLCLPAQYIAGKMMLVRAMVGNYTLVAVEPKANPFNHANLPPLHLTAITPYQLTHSLNDIERNAIQNIIVGGSPVDPALEKRVEDSATCFYETFGMTETASHIALRRMNGPVPSPYFTTLKGIEVGVDGRGCLTVSAPKLSATKWITNDLVEVVDSRTFRWLGRIDRVVNSGGIKICPETIERPLQSVIHQPFYVTGVPHPSLGQQLALVLESPPLSDLDIENLTRQMSLVLEKRFMPKQIICRPQFQYSVGNKLIREQF